MKHLGLALLLTLSFMQIEALLPPLYQTSSEIKAMMENKQLGQKLQSGEVIEKIEKNDQGYEITTNKNRLQVNVTYENQSYPAPAQHNLSFEDPIPLSQ